MHYVTTYDVGDRKRSQDGINEDSVAVTTLEDGHREGFSPPGTDVSPTYDTAAASPTVHGPRDTPEDTTETPETSGDEPTAEDQSRVKNEATDVFTVGDERQTWPRNRDAGIFVLADGAGGEQAGDIASYIATTVVTEELSGPVHRACRRRTGGFGLDIDEGAFGDPPDAAALQTAITEAAVAANEAIVEYARKANLGGLYTTLVVGIKIGRQLHYGWIGDSRLYVVNDSHKEIAALTKDHAKVTRWEDEGRIDVVEAHVHPEGNEISSALGGGADTTIDEAAARAERDVETNTVPLYREDRILLTSDGLIDAQTDAMELYRRYVGSDHDPEVAEEVLNAVVTDELIRDVVLEADTLRDAADRFVTLSNKKGGKDNISIVLASDDKLPAAPDPDESGLPTRAVNPTTPLEDRDTVVQ